MRKIVFILLVILISIGCKNKKTLSGSDAVELNDFLEGYPTLKLPFNIVDSDLKKNADTTTISTAVFTQFVPDTLLNTPFGKERKLTIKPIGKAEEKGKETYIITSVSSKTKTAVYLVVFNKGKFSTAMPLVIPVDDDRTRSASIDKKFTIVINNEWTVNESPLYYRTIYAYNNVGTFTTILTETNNQSATGSTIFNPLDTLPKKFIYSGDYTKSKRNFVTIRDGSSPNSYLFFVHFENEDEEACNGEVRGELKMTADKKGEYREKGSTCVIDFTFSGSTLKVKEQGGCGNYRGIKCFFNDTYEKKREAKSAKKVAKTK